MESLTTVADLITRPEFLSGLLAGGLVMVFFMFFSAQSDMLGWGVGVVLATTVAISFVFAFREGLILGLCILFAGGWLLRPPRRPFDQPTGSTLQPLAWIVIGSGAWIVTNAAGVEVSPIVSLASPIIVVAGGYLLSQWETLSKHALLGPLFAITAFGIWITVPETNLARVLLGVSVALAPATLSWGRFRRISSAGAFALVGLTVWIISIGGEARQAAIIGSWGALGMVALLPVLGRRSESLSTPVIVTLHLILVFLFTRVIGLWTDLGAALIAAILLMVVVYSGLVLTTPRVTAE